MALPLLERLTELGSPFSRVGISPDRLLEQAAPVLTAPDSGVAGLHLFTFNQLQQAEQFRRAALERTGTSRSLLAG